MSAAKRVFVFEYCESGDLKKAAGAAGYGEKYAKRLLKEKDVAALIEERREKSDERLKRKVIEEWASIAFADVGDYLDFSSDCDGKTVITLKDSSKCGDTRAVCEVGNAANGTVKLKLYDKENALLQLSKLLENGGGKEENEDNTINVELAGEVKEWAK